MKKSELRKLIKELITEQQYGGCTTPLQTNPNMWGNNSCVQMMSRVMNKSWFKNWILNRHGCDNYTWPAKNLPQQAEAIMMASPNPQTGPYNSFKDIKNAANASGLGQPQKFKFKAKMIKGMYSQCMKQACGC